VTKRAKNKSSLAKPGSLPLRAATHTASPLGVAVADLPPAERGLTKFERLGYERLKEAWEAYQDDQFITELDKCLLRVPDDQQVRLYLLTYIFSNYRDHCFPCVLSRSDHLTAPVHPTREAGELMGDVRRHYLRILTGMFGRGRDRHPVGFGWLDKPVAKPNKTGGTTRYRTRRHPGDDYPHAHVVLQVRDYPSTPPLDIYEKGQFAPWIVPELQSSLIMQFERLHRSSSLATDWLRLNPDGSLDVREIQKLVDAPEVLDYAAKSAKRGRTLHDEMILLPFADPPDRKKMKGLAQSLVDGPSEVPRQAPSPRFPYHRTFVWRA
jgi:hypothetical protein